MSVIAAAVSRNLKMHWRDKTGVFFSFLAPLIILVLFLAFLGSMQVESLTQEVPGLARRDAQWVVQGLLVGAICFVTSMTLPMGAVGVLIDDQVNGRLDDLLAAPVPRRSLTVGYAASALVTALAGTFGVWAVGSGIMLVQGLRLPGLGSAVRTGVALTASCVVFSAFAAWLAAHIRSQNAFAAASTILGTMVGFVAGVYVPLGLLPAAVANTATALPFAQAATLVRAPWTAEAFAAMTAGAPSDVVESVSADLGLTATIAGHPMPAWALWASLAAYCAVFVGMATRGLSRMVRRR